MAFSVQQLYALLEEYDCDSSLGSRDVPLRTNMLVDFTIRHFTETDLTLGFNQWSPEGYGLKVFEHDHMFVPGDSPCASDLTLIWNVQASMPPVGQKIWLINVWEHECDVSLFQYDEHSSWCYATSASESRQGLHHLELFSGGVEVGLPH